MSSLKEQILQLVQEDYSYNQISEKLGCGKGTIAFHVKNSNMDPSQKSINLIDSLDWNSVQEYYDQGHTTKECLQKFNFSHSTWSKAVKLGYIVINKKSKTQLKDLDWNSVQEYYDQGYTIKECLQKFNFSYNTWSKAVKLGYIIIDEENKNNNGTPLENFDWGTIQEHLNLGYSINQCYQIFGFSRSIWRRAVKLGYVTSQDNRITPTEEIFCENSKQPASMVRRRILRDNLLTYECAKCGLDSWCGEKLPLELDHINGIRNDHRLENLRFLCPNCHSLTETYCGKNSLPQKLNEEQVIEIKNSLENSETIASLSRRYEVNPTTITSIRDNKTYKYIEN